MRWIIFALLLATASVGAVAEQLVEVTATRLNVRASPSSEAPIVYQVSKGDRLFVIDLTDDWAAISRLGGIDGYLATRYLKVPARHDEARDPAARLLLALVSVAFLVVIWLARRARRPSRYMDPKPSEHDAGFATGDPGEAPEQSPDTGCDIRDVYQARHQDEDQGREKVGDLPVARVQRVIDGDTVIVSNTWKKTKIRLDSIDCPEDGQHWGDIATAGLIKMIGGRRVRIEEHGEDSYGRLLATIYVQERHGSDWINVNEQMVVKGHAWVMRRYYLHLPADRKARLNRLEKWARTRKVGLWRTPQPIPPWRWRSAVRCQNGGPDGIPRPRPSRPIVVIRSSP